MRGRLHASPLCGRAEIGTNAKFVRKPKRRAKPRAEISGGERDLRDATRWKFTCIEFARRKRRFARRRKHRRIFSLFCSLLSFRYSGSRVARRAAIIDGTRCVRVKESRRFSRKLGARNSAVYIDSFRNPRVRCTMGQEFSPSHPPASNTIPTHNLSGPEAPVCLRFPTVGFSAKLSLLADA